MTQKDRKAGQSFRTEIQQIIFRPISLPARLNTMACMQGFPTTRLSSRRPDDFSLVEIGIAAGGCATSRQPPHAHRAQDLRILKIRKAAVSSPWLLSSQPQPPTCSAADLRIPPPGGQDNLDPSPRSPLPSPSEGGPGPTTPRPPWEERHATLFPPRAPVPRLGHVPCGTPLQGRHHALVSDTCQPSGAMSSRRKVPHCTGLMLLFVPPDLSDLSCICS